MGKGHWMTARCQSGWRVHETHLRAGATLPANADRVGVAPAARHQDCHRVEYSLGSPSSAWRMELARHCLLESVDAVVFCVDVGWRKPHRAPFDRALALLDVAATDAVFVGDDPRWDIVGAQNAGVRPVLLRSSASAPRVKVIQNLEDILSCVDEAPV